MLLSIRHDSLFIAVLGLLGGFATPALLSTGENRPIPLFAYLLLLNVGLAWVAYRARSWPVLTILTLVAHDDLPVGLGDQVPRRQPAVARDGHLPRVRGRSSFIALTLRAGAAATARWTATLERPGLAASAMPLVFAVYLAAVPAYGAHAGLLFGFLLLVDAGLLAVAIARARRARCTRSARAATVLVFAIWLATSYATRRLDDGDRRSRSRSSSSTRWRRSSPTRSAVRSTARRARDVCRAAAAVRVRRHCAHRAGGRVAAGRCSRRCSRCSR